MNAVESICFNRSVNLIHSAEIQYLLNTNIYLKLSKASENEFTIILFNTCNWRIKDFSH